MVPQQKLPFHSGSLPRGQLLVQLSVPQRPAGTFPVCGPFSVLLSHSLSSTKPPEVRLSLNLTNEDINAGRGRQCPWPLGF